MLRAVIGVLLLSVCAAAVDSQLTQSAYLDVQEKFYIEWQYTEANITILARVKTTGWFGIGFSTNGGMAGADIITAHVSNGTAYLQDRYSEQNGYPAMDQSQDVELLSGSEVDGVTTVKFTRKHNTCDDKDMVVGTDTMRVIYAISPDGKDQMSYHTPFNRGTRSIYLRQKFKEMKSSVPDDAKTIDIGVENITIPAHHTTYYCEVMRAPKLKTKHHLIKVAPLIEEANLGIVHHAIIYGCYDNVDREQYVTEKRGFDCTDYANMPRDVLACRTAIVAWGVGGGPMYYPEEAGYPIGGDDSPDYFLVEMHYDNPKLLSGIKDSSGFRLTLTPTLRRFDAGILGIGAVNGIAIPPGVKDFTSSGFCTSQCSQDNLKTDLNIFGSFLHGHLTTRQIIARHFRNGEELKVLDEDRHYDFNYQQSKMFAKPKVLKAGDVVLVQCHHNTMDRTNMTYGDLPSTSEMCVGFLNYYPAGVLDYCYSMAGYAATLPTDKTSTKMFVREKLEYTGDVGHNFKTAFDQITEAKGWTEKRVRQLEDSYLDTPHADLCLRRDFATNHQYLMNRKPFTPPVESRNPPPLRDYEKECTTDPTGQPDSVIG